MPRLGAFKSFGMARQSDGAHVLVAQSAYSAQWTAFRFKIDDDGVKWIGSLVRAGSLVDAPVGQPTSTIVAVMTGSNTQELVTLDAKAFAATAPCSGL